MSKEKFFAGFVKEEFLLIFQDIEGNITGKVSMGQNKAKEIMKVLDVFLSSFPGYTHGINSIDTDYGTITIIRKKDFKWLNENEEESAEDTDEEDDDEDFNPLIHLMMSSIDGAKPKTIKEYYKETINGKETESTK